MSDRIWLKNYPFGMPAEIDADHFESLADLIEHIAGKFADKPAFHNLGCTMSYAELARRSRDFAAFLQGLPGMAKGERVAIMSPNLLQYPVALFGILRAGMTVVNVNPMYTPRELEHQLKDSGAKTIVILENFAVTLQQVLRNTLVEHVITTEVGDLLPIPKRWLVNFVVKNVKKMVPAWQIEGAITFSAALARGAKLEFKAIAVAREDNAFLQYTGGTTGVAKGAMLTHRNMLANLEQTGVWVSRTFKEGTEIVIAPLPMYHIFCLTSTLSFMKWGSLIVLITNPRDVAAFVQELRQWKWSVMTGVNTLFNLLLNAPGFEKLDFTAVKVVVGGGAAIQKSVAERWKRVTGSYITEAYGLTETSPGVSANPLGAPWNGTIGLPFPSTDLSIRGENFSKLPLWTGEGDIEQCTGEICVRGPQVMKGYWNNPAETANVMQDGWLKTGDVGNLNAQGYVTITDRKKDMILVSGFKVFPNEVESVVAMHPGVLECGVVGVRDDKSGEAVKVVIVRQDPALTMEAVVEHCKLQLTAYKVPRYVEFRDALPKSPIGKVLRRELRDPPPNGPLLHVSAKTENAMTHAPIAKTTIVTPETTGLAATGHAPLPGFDTQQETLGDGTRVLIRPICKEDAELERAFLERLSPESWRYRFLGQIQLSEDMVKRLTDIDYRRDMALVALRNDAGEKREIGVGRFCTSEDGASCECAVAVSDEWQGRGLGHLLMRHLIEEARQRGIKRMFSIDAASNEHMRTLAASLGFEHKADPDCPGQVVYSLKL